MGNTKCTDCTSKTSWKEEEEVEILTEGEKCFSLVILTVSEMYKMSPSSKYSSSGFKMKNKSIPPRGDRSPRLIQTLFVFIAINGNQ